MASSYIFSTLPKFSDGGKTNLTTWLRRFERCCIVANKTDGDAGNVKGQLLILFVEGRAKAILEEYEEVQGTPQKYDDLVAKLKEHFDSVTTREHGMNIFESRVQKVTESEEEFMLELLKLYTAANPNHAADVQLTAIKRKFLQGISPEVRRNIFVFCNNPYAAEVTREKLLEHCYNAKTHLSVHNNFPSTTGFSTDKVLLSAEAGLSSDHGMVAAINNLSLQFQDHVRNTEKNFSEFGSALSVINNDRFSRGNSRRNRNYRGKNYNTYRYPNNNTRYSGGNRNNSTFQNGTQNFVDGQEGKSIRCFKCNGMNHFAKNCLSRSGSGSGNY